MASEVDQILSFLSNTHLFHSNHLNENMLYEVASLFTKTHLAESDVLYHQGEQADSFYFVMEGQVRLSQSFGQNNKKTTRLSAGDFFGEEAFTRKASRRQTVTAGTDCLLLRIDQSQFRALKRIVPEFKSSLSATLSNRRLGMKKRWNWMNPDETIYVLLRKHPYVLYTNLILPMTFLAFGLFVFIYGFFYIPFLKGTGLVEIIGGAWCFGTLLWFGWRIWDWSNDYSFVTSQRVIWLEKVVGIYQSRQEAPIRTILSVGVVSDQIGRMVGYGNVIVRTFTGSITLSQVKDPKIVASIIEEQLRRSKSVVNKEEASEIERAIRSSLGIDSPENQQTVQKDEETQKPVKRKVEPGFINQLFAYLFRVRIDAGGVVTYRKHWFVLIGATWKQLVLFLLVIIALVGRKTEASSFLSSNEVLLFVGFSLAIIFLWWLYDVIDWHNDIYQVTPDQIIDIERKPFGSEKKRTAPLENILSIEYQRLGVLGLLFNYGTVFIKIGNATFDFEYVVNPSRVQQDIFYRKLEKEASQKKSEKDAERERLSSWIATYHRYNERLSTGNQPPSRDLEGQNGLQGHDEDEQKPSEDGKDRDGFGWIE